MVIIERKSNIDILSILIGLIGAIITFTGLFVQYPQPYYIFGSFLLLTTALHFRIYFFVALEIILISGHSSILLGIGPMLQIALPTLLTFQLLFYYFFSGQKGDIATIIGVIGIGLISVGFSIKYQWIFLFGSLFISVFAYFNLKRTEYISLLWLILNLFFALTALVRLIFS